MKKLLFVAAVAASMLIAGCSERQQLKKSLKSALEVAVQHEKAQAEVMLPREGEMPKTFEKGELVTANIRWWTSGFFPGSLWLLYEHTGDEELRQYAEQFTSRLESLKDYTGTHDLGFMVFCSYGNAYRLTGDEYYKGVIEQAAKSLVTRYNPTVGCIRSWNTHRKENPELDFMVIIDNMMNLEMLEWVGGYDEITRSHAYTTIKNHFRDDYSTYHVVAYNEQTGEVVEKRTAQGFSDDSAWARGQAWGLYGYTMMYRETGEKRYLEQAEKVAEYLFPLLAERPVPVWDFDAPAEMSAQTDASAGAVMAAAYVELSTLTEKPELADKCLAQAEAILAGLCSPEYLAEEGEIGGFLLKHGCGFYLKNSEIDNPLTYADYYFLEALHRYNSLK